MTGGGILALVAYGAQNVILSGNPQMTYFYKAFKRYTHFAMENITIPLEGPNELSYDAPVRLRAKIPRYGDLMSDLYFSFRIPDIFSKYVDRPSQWEFQWVRYLGAALIQNAAVFVGGQKIQEVDGAYLLTRALNDMDQDTFSKWKTLVGDVPELTSPAIGVYAGGPAATGYPTVVQDTTRSTAQANRPSVFGREIHVPLSFWFTESPSQALPLIGLQSHECEIQLTLAPLTSLYTVLDVSGQRVNPDFHMVATAAEIVANNPAYAASSEIGAQIRNFYTDFGVSAPTLNQLAIQPRLQGTFIYLPKEEQQVFAGRPLNYIMHRITKFPFTGLYNRQILDVLTTNPITRLTFVQRRSDAAQRNDFANFTNWFKYPVAPFQPTPGSPPITNGSGLLISNAQQEILRSVRVLCDGNEIQEPKAADYFNRLVPYKYLKGIGQDGLLVYSFELEYNSIQPSGSINASRIKNFQVELDVYPLPVNPNYTYAVDVYVDSINWFEVVSGMGGLKYAL